MNDHAALIERARAICEALCLAQIGDANAMAEAQAVATLPELEADPVLTRLVLRILAATVAKVADVALVAGELYDDPATRYDLASQLVRPAILGLGIDVS